MADEEMKLCRVSMCPPQENTDTGYIEDNAPLLNRASSCFIVEFGGSSAEIYPEVGQHISDSELIATIDDAPVKSIMNGTVTEKHDRYIIGKYDSSFSGNTDASSYIVDTETSYGEVMDLMKKYQHSVAFINDYVLRFRFADFTSSISKSPTLSGSTVSDLAGRYEKAADKIQEQFEKDIRRICDRNHVRTECENDNLLGIKKEIDDARDSEFAKIFDLYGKSTSYGQISGSIADFMLYEMYLDYITGESFIYDDENPYVTELLERISETLKVRSKIELNGTNIDGLVARFNEMCRKNISQYWTPTEKGYYSTMKEMFQYNFYTSDAELTEAQENDTERVTLYSKVLEYLKTLTGYTPPVSAEEKYKDTPIGSLTGMSTEDVQGDYEDTTKELKRIALMFTILRKVEIDQDDDAAYYTQYISEEDLNNVFDVRDRLRNTLTSFSDYYAGTTSIVLNTYASILQKYLGALQKLAEKERDELRGICDRAISWYNANHDGIESGKIFDQFKEVNWSSASTVYKDGVSHDFYYLNPAPKDEDEETEDTGYEYTEDSVYTEYGIDSYKYWKRYFTVATIADCAMPAFWSTGLPPPTGPIPLPIIFIPIVVLSSRVTAVIGLGICGICPLPMLYFVNIGDIPGCMIPAVNNVVDSLKNLTLMIVSAASTTVKGIISQQIKSNEAEINKKRQEIKDIEIRITNLRCGIEEDKEVMRELKKKVNKKTTTH